MKITKLPSVLALATLMLSGCASTMQETNYQSFSNFMGNLHRCFEGGYIGPQEYADAKTAFSYSLGTWKYDSAKLSDMINQSYSGAYATESGCRNVQAYAYQMISSVNQFKAEQREGRQAFDNTMNSLKQNKPVFCNTVGTMTYCY